jgi:hypothetical protein
MLVSSIWMNHLRNERIGEGGMNPGRTGAEAEADQFTLQGSCGGSRRGHGRTNVRVTRSTGQSDDAADQWLVFWGSARVADGCKKRLPGSCSAAPQFDTTAVLGNTDQWIKSRAPRTRLSPQAAAPQAILSQDHRAPQANGHLLTNAASQVPSREASLR